MLLTALILMTTIFLVATQDPKAWQNQDAVSKADQLVMYANFLLPYTDERTQLYQYNLWYPYSSLFVVKVDQYTRLEVLNSNYDD